MYVLDRPPARCSRPIRSCTPRPKGVDLETGRPIEVEEKKTGLRRVVRDICPGGARRQGLAAVGVVAAHGPALHPAQQPVHGHGRPRGELHRRHAVRRRARVMKAGPGGHRGEFTAWDPVRGAPSGRSEERFPVWSGAVVTAGDVVFYGTMDRWFKAVARAHRRAALAVPGRLGHHRPADHLPRPDGKQYVAVLSGVGGWAGAVVSGGLDARPDGGARLRRRHDRPAAVHGGGRHALCLRAALERDADAERAVRADRGAWAARSRGGARGCCRGDAACGTRGSRRSRTRRRARVCASAPIPTTCRSRTSARRASRTAWPSWSPPRWRGRALHVVGAAARLHPQHAARARVRRRDGRADELRARARHTAVLPLHVRLRLRRRPRARRAQLDDEPAAAADRRARHRRRLRQPPAGPRAGEPRHHQNVVGYSIFGDYSEPNPPARLVDAVATGEVDVAVVWGPLAGYFARGSSVPLTIVPVSPEIDLPFLPFVFDIAMGVRRDDQALRDELDEILVARGRTPSTAAARGVRRPAARRGRDARRGRRP
jgi:hypothetical protein